VCVCVCVCVSLPAAREAGISSSITAALLKTNSRWMVVLGNDLAAFVLAAQVVNHYSLTILLK